MQTIKTFEAACKALKLNPLKCLPVVTNMPKHHQAAIVANAKLVIIAEALNEGWKPNWNDSNEYKWHPYFEVRASKNKPSGSGLSFNDADSWNSYTVVGSRLCFKSRELAEYAGTHFKKLYHQSYLLD